MLKPQDIVVLLKVYGLKGEWTYSELAKSLKMSSLEVHGALKHCSTSGLYNDKRRRVLKPALEEFLIHGLKYVFPTQLNDDISTAISSSEQSLKQYFCKYDFL